VTFETEKDSQNFTSRIYFSIEEASSPMHAVVSCHMVGEEPLFFLMVHF
jgi:hypothetical protein